MLSRFKPPGGALSWYTALCVCAAAPGLWVAFSTGRIPWYVGLILFVAVLATLMWFGVRPAGYVFGVTVGLLAVFASIGMVGLATVSVGSVVRLLFYFHAAYEAIQWARGRPSGL